MLEAEATCEAVRASRLPFLLRQVNAKKLTVSREEEDGHQRRVSLGH